MNLNGENHAFSFLELLVVVAIILIVSATAIPMLLRSRQETNEAGAVANLRTIRTAENTYRSSTLHYATMWDLVNAGLLDSGFTSGAVGGYTFSITMDSQRTTFTTDAKPATINTGRYSFYGTKDGVVHWSAKLNEAPAGKAGNPVE
jgi:prepilin-type N-terminal cleavage/methylation domain-containing protein